MFAAEGLSLAAFQIPVLALPLLIAAGVLTLFLSWRKPEWGIYILFGELFIGSRGHLFEYDLGPAAMSLRLVIFGSVFLVWLIQNVKIKNQNDNLKFKILYLALLGAIGFGIINGYLRGNSVANIFNDANGYLFLLILPAVLAAIKTREQIENILKILGAGIIVIAAKTLGLFLWFTFDWPGVAALYHWIIAQDFGEITGNVGSASRIFMQSQFWALIGLFIFSFFTLPSPLPSREGNSSPWGGEVRWGWGIWIIISAALLSLIMSLSRSFWLGAVAGVLFALVVILWHFRPNFKAFLAIGLKLGLIVIVEIGVLYSIIMFSGGGVAESVSSRGTNPVGEAAGNARLLLLPELVSSVKNHPVLGSGFGTLVSYKSYLPDRVTAENPDGEITNFAFEWGYLDIALKVGLLGLVVYLFFVANIFAEGWKAMKYQISNIKFQTLGWLSGLVALLALNLTTPYLNHPLGIGFLIFLYSLFSILNSDHEPAR